DTWCHPFALTYFLSQSSVNCRDKTDLHQYYGQPLCKKAEKLMQVRLCCVLLKTPSRCEAEQEIKGRYGTFLSSTSLSSVPGGSGCPLASSARVAARTLSTSRRYFSVLPASG